MDRNKSYTGIDLFRFVASVMVIAIHTSPLLSYNTTADFIFTKIFCRIAVPFFLMTTGYFLISRYNYNNDKLINFIKKTSVLYAISILIYIPLNIYNDYFNIENFLPNLIKDIIFDGTVYHLWYLPASIIGAVIAWFTVKKLELNKSLVITSVLYIIGLFGDSYYGVSECIPFVKVFYNNIFDVMDYTRNGLFFTPVFIVLGGIIADKQKHTPLKQNILYFGISFILMFTEAMLLHIYDLQKHDSMYIMIVPCMYYFFSILTHWRGKRMPLLRTSALTIYIVHPMIIVIIRMLAKLSGTQKYLVENSIIHFSLVCISSIVFAFVFTIFTDKLKTKFPRKIISKKERAWIEIDLDNLKHNVNVLKQAMPSDCELMAVVKDEAYGHDGYEVSTYLNKIGVKAFAVATVDEGIKLRKYGIIGEILILGYTDITRIKHIRKYNLIQTVIDYEYTEKMAEQNVKINVHIKIDTGMHRLGFSHDDIESIKNVFAIQNLNVCGIYTHLCVSDSLDDNDVNFTKLQVHNFYTVMKTLDDDGIRLPKFHVQSSYGLLNYPELDCDYVRVGIALYGVLSSASDKTKLKLDLRPVLSLKSKIILIRRVQNGESVGYGRSFITDKDSIIAILPIGYADGLPRNLTHYGGYALIKGQYAKIVGRICMDQLAVDITGIDDVHIGTTAVLIGFDVNNELSVSEIAEISNTISNEILSRMGARLPVIIKD